jgi:murein DD-endopeptidase MepM/ murein hydrolase activator NlpD
MDIGAPRGTPIVASRSGTVMVANGSDEWGYSWGYYVSIYHDSTYSTLYAHMSSVAVSAGQKVKKGDIIGYVGNTGYSFGNHLHFEVYKDGTRVNPGAYV